jgi:ABC-type amino acid transport substrate-binding protein
VLPARGFRTARRAAIVALLCAPPVAAAADLDAVAARGTLRVLAAVDDDPAWFSSKEGRAPGFEREVLEGFARLHKLRFEAVSVGSWANAIPMLLEGRGDLLAGVNDTPSRRRQVDFTAELLPARHVVVTRRPQATILTADALRGARVAVVPDTTWAEAVAAAGVSPSRTVIVADVPAALESLRAGRATATVADVLDFLLQRRRDRKLQAGMTLGGGLSSAWAVRKTDPQLRGALDAYLAGLRRSANWSRLLVKYFGDDAPAVLRRLPPQE